MAVRIGDTLKQINNADFPIVEAMDVAFESGDTLQELYDSGALSGGGGASYITLSQEEYDVLSDEEKVNGSEYRTYDTGHIYKLGIEYGKDGVQISDNETVEDKTWSSKKTSDEIEEANVYKGKYVGDLNDIPFIKSGVVYKYDIRSGNCTNTPVGTHGILYSTYFDSDNYCLQEFHPLQTNKASIYRRDKGTGVWSDWTELATMDKVVPSDNYSTITKSIKLTRRTKTYIFKDVNTSETKRYFELNVNGNVSHSGDVFFRKYVGLLYLYPWTGASRGLYLEQVQHIGLTVNSIQIDIAYGWDENGVYIQNNGTLNLSIDIVAPSSWFVN